MQRSFLFPLIVFLQYNLYLLEITIRCDNSLTSSIKMFMLLHHFIEIILNNLCRSLASFEVSVSWWQNIFYKTTIFDIWQTQFYTINYFKCHQFY